MIPPQHPCTARVTPPAHEAAFASRGRQWVALLWWCEPDQVWDVVVYETRAGRFRWQCSGVAMRRFVTVTGECGLPLRDAIWSAIRGAMGDERKG